MALPGFSLSGIGGGPSSAGTAPQDSKQTIYFGGARKGANSTLLTALIAGAVLLYVVKKK
jgi:hypothetical protein